MEEDSATSIGLANALPISDEEGKNSEQVYRFSVVNNSDTDLAYKIYLDNDSKAKEKCGNTCEEMSGDMVKYELRKEEESSINSLSSRLLKIDNIKANSKNTYELRLWLGTNADDTVSEKYFFGQIKVEAIYQ